MYFYRSESVNVRISVCDREYPPGLEIGTYRETEDIYSFKMFDASHTVRIKPTSSTRILSALVCFLHEMDSWKQGCYRGVKQILCLTLKY